MKRWFRSSLLVASLSATTAIVTYPRLSHGIVVERIVAVVGEHAIFLSDLRLRARTVLAQIHQQVPPGPQRSAVESKMYRSLLERMVDERLEQIAAERAKLSVSSEEIDRGLQNIATREKLTTDQLFTEIVRSGSTVQEYRDEIRRQLLDQKLISLRVSPRVRIAPEDIRIGYARLQREERRQLGYRPQWIVLRIKPDASAEVRDERRQVADDLVRQVRAGSDFSALARRHSDDAPTRGKGGDLGTVKPGELAQEIEQVAFALDVGEVSNPFVYGNDLIVLRIAERNPSSLPPLNQAQEEVANRVYGERLEKARRQWLDELKKGVYVDVRL